MTLHAKLLERESAGKPVTVGVIGAGKFGTMYLSQARLTAGTHVVAVADLDIARARSQLNNAGWPAELYAATSLDDAHKRRATFITADADAMSPISSICSLASWAFSISSFVCVARNTSVRVQVTRLPPRDRK